MLAEKKIVEIKYTFSDWARYNINLIKYANALFITRRLNHAKNKFAEKLLEEIKSAFSDWARYIINIQVHICYTQIESALKICLLKKYLQKLSMTSQTGPDIS